MRFLHGCPVAYAAALRQYIGPMVLVKRFLKGDIVAIGTVGYDGFERNTYGFDAPCRDTFLVPAARRVDTNALANPLLARLIEATLP
jgi:hypothetical protein